MHKNTFKGHKHYITPQLGYPKIIYSSSSINVVYASQAVNWLTDNDAGQRYHNKHSNADNWELYTKSTMITTLRDYEHSFKQLSPFSNLQYGLVSPNLVKSFKRILSPISDDWSDLL